VEKTIQFKSALKKGASIVSEGTSLVLRKVVCISNLKK
jgi:hypothetical protein